MSLIEDLCQVTVFDRQGCNVMRSLYKTVDPFRFNDSGIIPKLQSNESQTYYYCDVGYDGWPPGAATQCALHGHNLWCNRHDRDRTAGRELPDSGNVHNGRVEHWASSAVRADEGWILTRPGAIIGRLCESTVWGMASG